MREKINSVHERFIFEKENSLRVQKKKFMFEKFVRSKLYLVCDASVTLRNHYS